MGVCDVGILTLNNLQLFVTTTCQCAIILSAKPNAAYYKRNSFAPGDPSERRRGVGGLVVEYRPAALKVLGSNPVWGAQEFPKLTQQPVDCMKQKLEGAMYSSVLC